MRAGAATLLVERPSPEALLDVVEKHRPTVLFTAPTSYRAMALACAGRDLASLRKCVSAGEALPAATRKLWKDATGIDIIDGIGSTELFRTPQQTTDTGKGYTLAQKMVGRACGVTGVRPGAYCEPMMTTVGSQDTTGPMTRDELKDLACLGFSADLVMQSFCHTAAYPKPCLLYTSPSPRDRTRSRMPSSA